MLYTVASLYIVLPKGKMPIFIILPKIQSFAHLKAHASQLIYVAGYNTKSQEVLTRVVD